MKPEKKYPNASGVRKKTNTFGFIKTAQSWTCNYFECKKKKTDSKSNIPSNPGFYQRKKLHVFENIGNPLWFDDFYWSDKVWTFWAVMQQELLELVYTFFKNFDRKVKLYLSTEKCPNRDLHNLLRLSGRLKVYFCQQTFLLISISTNLCNKKVSHFT